MLRLNTRNWSITQLKQPHKNISILYRCFSTPTGLLANTSKNGKIGSFPKPVKQETTLDKSNKTYDLRFNIEKMIKEYSSKKIMPTSDIWKSYNLQYLNDGSRTNENINKSTTFTADHIYLLNLQTLNLLLIYTCKRIKAFGKLPYIAVINPKIEQNNNLYYQTLTSLLIMLDNLITHKTTYLSDIHDKLLDGTESNMEAGGKIDNDSKMVFTLDKFIKDHNDSLLALSVGLQQIVENNWLNQDEMTCFLNEHLRDRIFMKTLASHHLEILKQTHAACNKNNTSETPSDLKSASMIGIIHPELKISTLIREVHDYVSDLCFIKYDVQVPISIKYGEDITFTCIPTDLEYILTELLKNSSKAHIESGKADVPIEVTIFKTQENEKQNLHKRKNSYKIEEEEEEGNDEGNSETNSEIPSKYRKKQVLEIRVRDFGGGISPAVEDKILNYSFSTTAAQKNENGMFDNTMPGEQVNTISGMGFGLPLCQAYLDMYDGVLDIQSLYGYGTDVYIKLQSNLTN